MASSVGKRGVAPTGITRLKCDHRGRCGASRLNTARGTPWVWRTCGTLCRSLEPERKARHKDFDKPRCREASRPAGPIGPLASRAPFGWGGRQEIKNDGPARGLDKEYGRWRLRGEMPPKAVSGITTLMRVNGKPLPHNLARGRWQNGPDNRPDTAAAPVRDR